MKNIEMTVTKILVLFIVLCSGLNVYAAPEDLDRIREQLANGTIENNWVVENSTNPNRSAAQAFGMTEEQQTTFGDGVEEYNFNYEKLLSIPEEDYINHIDELIKPSGFYHIGIMSGDEVYASVEIEKTEQGYKVFRTGTGGQIMETVPEALNRINQLYAGKEFTAKYIGESGMFKGFLIESEGEASIMSASPGESLGLDTYEISDTNSVFIAAKNKYLQNQQPNQLIGGGGGTNTSEKVEPTNQTTLWGIVGAGVVLLLLLGAMVFYFRRRRVSK